MDTDEKRSTRNKTLSLDAQEREELCGRLLRCDKPVSGQTGIGSDGQRQTLPDGRTEGQERNLKRSQSDNRKLEIGQILDRTICADTLELLPVLPDSFADLIIVDPPYNLSKNFNGRRFRESSDEDYYEYLKGWFGGICRLMKPSGSLYLCGDWHCTAALYKIMSEHLTVMNRITWQREKGRGAKNNWKNSMEDIWFGVKNEKSYYFDLDAVKQKRRVLAPYKQGGIPKDWQQTDDGKFRLTCPSNFWDDISIPYWSMPENTVHPTQKPEKLIAKLILASCPPGGVVFDPFLGSGTTSVTAKKLGRHYCGIEIDEEYCLLAEKRLLMAERDTAIQGYSGGVFWERNTAALQKAEK